MHLESDHPVLKIDEMDIATVFLNHGTNTGLQNLLDGGEYFIVFILGSCVFVLNCLFFDDGMSRSEKVFDGLKDVEFDRVPHDIWIPGDGDEIRGQVHATHSIDIEEGFGERRRVRGQGIRKVLAQPFRHDTSAHGIEFQTGRIGSLLHSNKKCPLLELLLLQLLLFLMFLMLKVEG